MSANEKYQQLQKEITDLLKQINDGLEKHADKQKSFPSNYGYVGDLSRVRDDLYNINLHINFK